MRPTKMSKAKDNSRSNSKNASLSRPKKIWKPTNNAPAIPEATDAVKSKAEITNIRDCQE